MSSDHSSQPPFETFRPGRPKSNDAVLWTVVGSVFGSFALCGFCFILAPGLFISPGPNKAAQAAANAFIARLSDTGALGGALGAWSMLSNTTKATTPVLEFAAQVYDWPMAEDAVGAVEVVPSAAPSGKQGFTATATDKKGTIHRLELELVIEDGRWKVESCKLK